MVVLNKRNNKWGMSANGAKETGDRPDKILWQFTWSKVIENAVANYKWLGDSDTAAALCILPADSVVYQK